MTTAELIALCLLLLFIGFLIGLVVGAGVAAIFADELCERPHVDDHDGPG